jgi:L-lysine exporter family protein LysE/ArgO
MNWSSGAALPSVEDMLTLLAGLGFGLSLIVAIGAQNAFVLRQGLRREHVGVVVAICAVSDAVLYAAGAAGFGPLVERWPDAVVVVRWLGAAVVVGYGAMAAWRAVKGDTTLAAADDGALGDSPGRRLKPVVLTAVALTWLNPHVYLDTVILLGSVAAAHGDARWWFGLGAACGSVLWFTGLGFGARLLRRPFAKPAAWRALDGGVALVMGAIGVSLVV